MRKTVTPHERGNPWLHVSAMFIIAFMISAMRSLDDLWFAVGNAIGIAMFPVMALLWLLRGRASDTERIYRNVWIAFAVIFVLALYGSLTNPA